MFKKTHKLRLDSSGEYRELTTTLLDTKQRNCKPFLLVRQLCPFLFLHLTAISQNLLLSICSLVPLVVEVKEGDLTDTQSQLVLCTKTNKQKSNKPVYISHFRPICFDDSFALWRSETVSYFGSHLEKFSNSPKEVSGNSEHFLP